MFDIRSCDLQKLNSMTKYPSILTYHELDPKNGGLLDEPATWEASPQQFSGDVIGTEKVDGTNARIICFPTAHGRYGYVLGSREDLLYAKGDLIGNPVMGIVGAMKDLADDITSSMQNMPFHWGAQGVIASFFFELYGGNIGKASKQYTGDQRVGFRLFDAFIMGVEETASKIMAMERASIASWRDDGGQPYADEARLNKIIEVWGDLLDPRVTLTPRVFQMPATALPKTIEETHEFLQKTMPQTKVQLDAGGAGKAEGLVLRTPDRKTIAKARFEDYERTLRRRAKAKNG